MNRSNLKMLAVAASTIAIVTMSVAAQAAEERSAPSDSAPSSGLTADDIVVTARRREESLQDVPQTVNAVTGGTLEKLNLQRLEDIQAVVPGLTLSSGGNGTSFSATVRGASFSFESSAAPTVEFYLNDALVLSTYVFQSFFDVGQIEVLRGPQGTLRGRASPSGSITITTRRPDLNETGGMVDLSGTTRGGINAKAAFSLPLVKDVLAVRVAGIVDQNDYNDVHSINNRTNPYSNTIGGRVSVRFEPADFFSANVMYQHLDRKQLSFTQVESQSVTDPAATPSSRLILASDRLGITDGAAQIHSKQDVVTGNATAKFLGQSLTYVGSYSQQRLPNTIPQDSANIFPNSEFYQNLDTVYKQHTHEVRLASDERIAGIFDYAVGWFNTDVHADNNITTRSAVTFLGSLAAVAATPVVSNNGQKENSFFGNVTAHIGDQTELSGGVRHINFERRNFLSVSGATLVSARQKSTPTVYNFSLSHRFSDSFLAYANTGSSWRGGPLFVGVFRPLTPRLQKFILLQNETSKSYEVGIKTNFLDKRLRLDIAAYHQDFKNFIYRGSSVNYVDLTATGPQANSFNFGASVPAKVTGVDVDMAFQVTPRFNIGAAFSYAKSKIKGGVIACNDLNGDGIPDATSTTPTVAQIRAGAGGEDVAQCQVSDRLSFAPDWSLAVQSEYSKELTSGTDAFMRGLLSYYPKNVQDPRNRFDDVKAYGLLNLYLGVRDPGGAWEVSLYGKNITNTGVRLSRGDASSVATSVQALQPPTFRTTVGQRVTSGYATATYTPQREFGLNVRYAFGSR